MAHVLAGPRIFQQLFVVTTWATLYSKALMGPTAHSDLVLQKCQRKCRFYLFTCRKVSIRAGLVPYDTKLGRAAAQPDIV